MQETTSVWKGKIFNDDDVLLHSEVHYGVYDPQALVREQGQSPSTCLLM